MLTIGPRRGDTLEIDARRIPGGGGSVAWLYSETYAGPEHRILVRDSDGTTLSIRTFDNGDAARDAFNHPFASTAVERPLAFTR